MEYRTFSYDVKMKVEFTRIEIDTMTKCAFSHHEVKCRTAAETGGFLFGIQNRVQMESLASGGAYDPNVKFVTVLGLEEISTLYRIMTLGKNHWPDIFNELSGLKVVLEMEQKRLNEIAKNQEETEELMEV
jgi:hypothetical protein